MLRRVTSCAILSCAALARADVLSVHGTVTGQVAATDNVFAVPAGGFGGVAREGDVYGQVRPGLLLVGQGPRLVQELTAEAEVLAYARHGTEPSLSARGGWRAVFALSPTAEGTAQVAGGTGTVNALTSRTSPDQGQVALLPGGRTRASNVDALGRVVHELTATRRLEETITARWSRVGADAGRLDGTDLAAGLGLSQGWRADSLAVEGAVGLARFDRGAQGATPAGVVQLVGLTAKGTWRHDLDRHWSFDVDGGATVLTPTRGGERRQTLPLLGSQLAYVADWGRATLGARRAVGANLLVGQATVNDAVTAQVVLPLPWLDEGRTAGPPLAVVGLGGAGRTQLVDPGRGELVGSFAVYRADVGLTYAPAPNLGLALRYEYLTQRGDAAATTIAPSYARSTVFFSLTARWPEARAAAVPRRDSVRADRADVPALGGAPAEGEAGAAPAPPR